MFYHKGILRNFLFFTLSISAVVWIQPILALNLMQAYQLAIQTDPTLQQQAAVYRQDLQLIPQARSQLLPNSNITTSNTTTHLVSHEPPAGVFGYAYQNYMLSVTQPIFDYAAWANLAQAKAQVKQARATYDANVQTLIANTVSAYFGVLQAQDNLAYSIEEQKIFSKELSNAEKTYKVKLGTITDVYNAKARYDQSTASVLFYKNQIQQKSETLSQIIGVLSQDLAPVKPNVPLVSPNPANLQKWIDTALQQNFTLIAARYGMQASLENVSVQRAANLPVIDATGSYQHTVQGNAGFGPIDEDEYTAGIQLSLPIYQGGLILADTRAAIAQYEQAQAQVQISYRQALSNTRENYKNILSGIQQIKADREAIKSAYISMKSNQAAFEVGERTIIDVLDSQVTYINNKRIYSEALYTYLNSIIALKLAAGTLNQQDVIELNSWLVTA